MSDPKALIFYGGWEGHEPSEEQEKSIGILMKAAACLTKDGGALLAFYDFPVER